MMSSGIFTLSLLAVFVVCGRSLPDNYGNEATFSLDQISENNEIEMKFLENNILSGIDSSVHLCDDPHAALCGGEAKNRSRPLHLKQAYPYIRNYLIELLSQPVSVNEITALSIEKTLFSKCLNLGTKTDSVNAFATKKFVSALFENIFDVAGDWQNIDDKLNLKGIEHTFFDVAVERDSENPKLRIIVLQPPSYPHINRLNDFIKIVFDSASPQHISKSLTFPLFDAVDQKSVQEFFREWTKVFSQSSTQRKQERKSLAKWNKEYNDKNSDRATGKINWEKLVSDEFERVYVNITGLPSIIIRNKDYFLALADLLGNTSNDVIVGAIKTKMILENIRFIDYKYAESIKHRKRTLFCYSNTKLYGASFRLLRDLKKTHLSNAKNYEILDTMLRNIAEVLLFAIEDSKDLMPKEKTYLRAEVKVITSNILKPNKNKKIVDNYYEDYEISQSYFASIVNYRKMLKLKELISLTIYSKNLADVTEPFSVIDLAKPRNRFILNVYANSFLLARMPVPSGLQKEIHYGIYGVKIASFLYGLLNENRFANVNLTGRVDWYDHPEYPAKSLQCFVGQDIKSYGWGAATETVTQIFGSHIGYKAMLKDYAESQVRRQQEYLLTSPTSELIPMEADQLFFIAYGKYHCDFGQKELKTILLNLEEYNAAFECDSINGDFAPRCPLNGFQVQRKGRFLNQPF